MGESEPARGAPHRHDAGERRIFRRALALGLALAVLALLVLPTALNPVLRLLTVPASSMAPALPTGAFVLANRFSYGLSRHTYDWFQLPIAGRWPALAPKRGDVVVFRLPRDPHTLFVKRIIGLPGDRVQLIKGRLVLNGATVDRQSAPDLPDPTGTSSRAVASYTERLADGVSYRIIEAEGDKGYLDDTAELAVPPGHLFMLGDNRDNSVDSRMPADKMGVGFVPLDHLIGRVIYVFGGGSG